MEVFAYHNTEIDRFKDLLEGFNASIVNASEKLRNNDPSST